MPNVMLQEEDTATEEEELWPTELTIVKEG